MRTYNYPVFEVAASKSTPGAIKVSTTSSKEISVIASLSNTNTIEMWKSTYTDSQFNNFTKITVSGSEGLFRDYFSTIYLENSPDPRKIYFTVKRADFSGRGDFTITFPNEFYYPIPHKSIVINADKKSYFEAE